tara:strand:+ start:33 stop:236 length:204 start_codon:yes stop_codon:yes gene_type:complete
MIKKKDTRRDAWNYDYTGIKAYKNDKKYHDWVYMADDQINHVLKWVIIFIYACAAIAVASNLLSKFL